MINLIRSGFYRLAETKHQTKILYLDEDVYAWIEPKIGEILVITHKPHKTDCVLSTGRYRLYEVANEPALSDQAHLELEVGPNSWQGYLLLSGLPANEKKRGRIIPTHETITGGPQADYPILPVWTSDVMSLFKNHTESWQ